MSEVLAGLVCGYILSLIATPLVALTLLRMRARFPAVERTVPQQVPFPALAVVIHGFALMAFTALGMVFGLILSGIEERVPEGGLGSPNGVFTLAVLLWTVVAFAPIIVLLRPVRRQAAAMAILFALLFGWLMPYLAQWSPTNS
jgi:hypothetical protein